MTVTQLPTTSAALQRGVPPLPDPALRLWVPEDGIRAGDLVLRAPCDENADALALAFADPELREAGNLPELDAPELREMLPYLPALAASGRLLPLVVADATSGDILGGGTIHHLDRERGIVEIGYWRGATRRCTRSFQASSASATSPVIRERSAGCARPR